MPGRHHQADMPMWNHMAAFEPFMGRRQTWIPQTAGVGRHHPDVPRQGGPWDFETFFDHFNDAEENPAATGDESGAAPPYEEANGEEADRATEAHASRPRAFRGRRGGHFGGRGGHGGFGRRDEHNAERYGRRRGGQWVDEDSYDTEYSSVGTPDLSDKEDAADDKASEVTVGAGGLVGEKSNTKKGKHEHGGRGHRHGPFRGRGGREGMGPRGRGRGGPRGMHGDVPNLSAWFGRMAQTGATRGGMHGMRGGMFGPHHGMMHGMHGGMHDHHHRGRPGRDGRRDLGFDFPFGPMGGRGPHGLPADRHHARQNPYSFAGPVLVPEYDVFESELAYTVHVSLPGLKRKDVRVAWQARTSELHISGDFKLLGDEEFLKTMTLCGRNVGPFETTVRLGHVRHHPRINVAGITVAAQDGVLIVEVPKLTPDNDEITEIPIVGIDEE